MKLKNCFKMILKNNNKKKRIRKDRESQWKNLKDAILTVAEKNCGSLRILNGVQKIYRVVERQSKSGD